MNHRTASRFPLPSTGYAAQLRAKVAADPTTRVVAGIQGAGGHGKTTLLEELATVYREAEIPVVHGMAELPADVSADAAVLIDDAHLLAEPELSRLRALVDSGHTPLAVAYRPWPKSRAFGELVSALGRSGRSVLLGGLGLDDIARQAEYRLGQRLPCQSVEWLLEETQGVPRFVARLLDGLGFQELASHGQTGADRDGPPRVSRMVLEQFHHDLDQLDDHSAECVTAVEMGATPNADVLASLLDMRPRSAAEAMSALRASGLVDAEDVLVPVVHRAVRALVPWERRLSVLRRLVERQLDRGGPVLPFMRPLLTAEVPLVPEKTLAAAFEKAGDEALVESPQLAGRLFGAAVSTGSPESTVAARLARATANAGDLDTALRLADQVIVDESAADRAWGIQIASTVLAHRGLLERAAELCQWSVDHVPWSGDVAFSVVGLIGSGRIDEAEELLKSPRGSGPPTSLSGAVNQLADGMYHTITDSASTALSTLVRGASLSEPVGSTLLAPDTLASIASTVALHCGEFEVAESMLDRARELDAGGPLMRARHQLLSAWAPLLRGDTMTARDRLVAATADPSTLAVRDRLVATAIEAGIATRDNDMAGLADVRGRARKAVAEHDVDLFTLLPLSELVVAAARLRDQEWLASYVRQARSLLSHLGNPPLWSSVLHWRCLQAAIVLEDAEQAEEHSRLLRGLAEHNPMSTAMSEAATTWFSVLNGDIDQQTVEAAARGLHATGLAWDGARLAGQAALRTTDRPVMLALLECARSLQGKPPRPRAVRAVGPADAQLGTDALSDREREVAELVLSGLTYKQVGKRLFISAKTVEHHIGRVKQRLGCSNREELLTRLRALLDRESS